MRQEELIKDITGSLPSISAASLAQGGRGVLRLEQGKISKELGRCFVKLRVDYSLESLIRKVQH